MDLVRNSTSSDQSDTSDDSTAVDPESKRTTPKIGVDDERHDSSSSDDSISTKATSVPAASSGDNASDSSSDGSSDSSSDSDDDDSKGGRNHENKIPPNPEAPAPGWPQLAYIMSHVPEFAAFPRFKDLNVKSLLYYQIQLDRLREQIHKIEHDNGRLSERADLLVKRENSEHFKLIVKMRKVLKEYNKALLQYSKVSALPDPEYFNMRSLRKWLKDDRGGNHKVRVYEGDVQTWGDIQSDGPDPSLWKQFQGIMKALVMAQSPPNVDDLDLVVTHPPSKVDGLTKWVVYYYMPFYWSLRDRWLRKKSPSKNDEEATKYRPNEKPTRVLNTWHVDKALKESLESVSESAALRFTSSLSTVIACLIPVVAITVLTQLSETRDLLLCITGFAVVFAVGLIFLTQGTSSRTEIFAATAAFSAVMVVFISQPIIKVPPGSEMPEITV